MTQDVFRRRVFYIPGFDPFPPRRYRELYRTESQEQARISDYTVAQEPLRRTENFGWRVSSTIEGRDAVSDITVLTWSDLVKSSMERGVLWTYLSLIKTAWIYISSGALRDVMKLRKGPVIAALYPVGFLIAQLGFAILCAAVLSSVLWPLHSILGILSWWIRWQYFSLPDMQPAHLRLLGRCIFWWKIRTFRRAFQTRCARMIWISRACRKCPCCVAFFARPCAYIPLCR